MERDPPYELTPDTPLADMWTGGLPDSARSECVGWVQPITAMMGFAHPTGLADCVDRRARRCDQSCVGLVGWMSPFTSTVALFGGSVERDPPYELTPDTPLADIWTGGLPDSARSEYVGWVQPIIAVMGLPILQRARL